MRYLMDLSGLRNQMKDVSGRLPGKETPVFTDAMAMGRAGSMARDMVGKERLRDPLPWAILHHFYIP